MKHNVKFTSGSDYVNDLLKSLSNFCSKAPLINITINYIKDMNKVYVNYDNQAITIDINPLVNKKIVIGNIKKQLETFYPSVYKMEKKILDVDEIEQLVNDGVPLKEALSRRKDVETKIFKVIRAHQNYNELDMLSLEDNEIYKYKCKVPVSSILERLKYKDTTVLDDMKLMYKLEKK